MDIYGIFAEKTIHQWTFLDVTYGSIPKQNLCKVNMHEDLSSVQNPMNHFIIFIGISMVQFLDLIRYYLTLLISSILGI